MILLFSPNLLLFLFRIRPSGACSIFGTSDTCSISGTFSTCGIFSTFGTPPDAEPMAVQADAVLFVDSILEYGEMETYMKKARNMVIFEDNGFFVGAEKLNQLAVCQCAIFYFHCGTPFFVVVRCDVLFE